MGAEQSRGGGFRRRIRKNSLEDPPYATATQPIGESPRRLLKTQSLSMPGSSGVSALQGHSPKSTPIRSASSVASSTANRWIVTVNDGVSPSTEVTDPARDPVLLTLQKVPTFYPIIRDTVRNPVMKEITGTSCRLDIGAATALVTRYQTLIRENAEGVSKEQTRLGQRLQDMDYAVGTLHQVLQDRSIKLSKQTDQLSTVSQICALLNSSRSALQQS
ncbi:uncharacterized protein LOC111273095 isoform X2 [Varroa jacobsoni]|uniref:BLOC-1-related complex subunit 5 n=1 Tax=Varroa destructor TaxID=109461 RepID=A0A7M7KEY8_VARDE|nr:uncharacterized protein LOC111252348 isoform X2 [Varroa destructor]XP_022710518.1 uncharacterized protein LOC111273095 isoform X2 [Varroa jacobsoni]